MQDLSYVEWLRRRWGGRKCHGNGAEFHRSGDREFWAERRRLFHELGERNWVEHVEHELVEWSDRFSNKWHGWRSAMRSDHVSRVLRRVGCVSLGES